MGPRPPNNQWVTILGSVFASEIHPATVVSLGSCRTSGFWAFSAAMVVARFPAFR